MKLKKLRQTGLLLMISALVLSGCTSEPNPTTPPSEVTTEATTLLTTPTRGVWTDNIYTNAFANIRFTRSDGFTIKEENYLVESSGLDADSFCAPGEAFTDAMLESPTIHDMAALSTNGADVAVVFNNLRIDNPFGDTDTSAESFLNIMQMMIAQQEQTDDMLFVMDKGVTDFKLGDNDYKMLKATMTFETEDGTYYVYQHFLARKVGDYIVTVIITYGGAQTLAGIATAFL